MVLSAALSGQTTLKNSSIAVQDILDNTMPFEFNPIFRYDTTAMILYVFDDGSWTMLADGSSGGGGGGTVNDQELELTTGQGVNFPVGTLVRFTPSGIAYANRENESPLDSLPQGIVIAQIVDTITVCYNGCVVDFLHGGAIGETGFCGIDGDITFTEPTINPVFVGFVREDGDFQYDKDLSSGVGSGQEAVVLFDFIDSDENVTEVVQNNNVIFNNSKIEKQGQDVTITSIYDNLIEETGQELHVKADSSSIWVLNLGEDGKMVVDTVTSFVRQLTVHVLSEHITYYSPNVRCANDYYVAPLLGDKLHVGYYREGMFYTNADSCLISYVGEPVDDIGAELTAIVNFANSKGYTPPSTAHLLRLDTMISALVAGNFLDSIDGFYVFTGDGDEDFKAINLVDVVSDTIGSFSGTYVVDNTGFTGSGTGGYFRTNMGIMGAQVATASDIMVGGWLYGVDEIGGNGYAWGTSSTRYRAHDAGYLTSSFFRNPAALNTETGWFMAHRFATDTIRYTYNSLVDVQQLTGNTALFSDPYVCATNTNNTGVPDNYSDVTVSIFMQGAAVRRQQELYLIILNYMNNY